MPIVVGLIPSAHDFIASLDACLCGWPIPLYRPLILRCPFFRIEVLVERFFFHRFVSFQVRERAVYGLDQSFVTLNFVFEFLTMHTKGGRLIEIRRIKHLLDFIQGKPEFPMKEYLLKPK